MNAARNMVFDMLSDRALIGFDMPSFAQVGEKPQASVAASRGEPRTVRIACKGAMLKRAKTGSFSSARNRASISAFDFFGVKRPHIRIA